MNQVLQKAINTLLESIEKREAKIGEKRAMLLNKAAQLKQEIEGKTTAILDHELADDQTAADKTREAARKLRLLLAETEDEIQSLESYAGKTDPAMQTGLDKVRNAAQTAFSECRQSEQNARANIQKMENELDQLKNRIQQAKNQLRLIDTYPIVQQVSPMLRKQYPWFDQMGYYEQETIIKRWVAGDDFEALPTTKPESNGPTISYGEGHRYGYGPNDYVKGMNGAPVVIE